MSLLTYVLLCFLNALFGLKICSDHSSQYFWRLIITSSLAMHFGYPF